MKATIIKRNEKLTMVLSKGMVISHNPSEPPEPIERLFNDLEKSGCYYILIHAGEKLEPASQFFIEIEAIKRI